MCFVCEKTQPSLISNEQLWLTIKFGTYIHEIHSGLSFQIPNLLFCPTSICPGLRFCWPCVQYIGIFFNFCGSLSPLSLSVYWIMVADVWWPHWGRQMLNSDRLQLGQVASICPDEGQARSYVSYHN